MEEKKELQKDLLQQNRTKNISAEGLGDLFYANNSIMTKSGGVIASIGKGDNRQKLTLVNSKPTWTNKSLAQYTELSSSYTITTDWATITSLSAMIPSDGIYELKFEGQATIIDTNATQAYGYIRIAVNGIEIDLTSRLFSQTSNANGLINIIPFSISYVGSYSTDDNITAEAKMAAGDNCIISTSTDYRCYLSYREL